MGSLRIEQNGNVNVSPNINVNGGTMGQVPYQGGSSSVTPTQGGSVAYNGNFVQQGSQGGGNNQVAYSGNAYGGGQPVQQAGNASYGGGQQQDLTAIKEQQRAKNAREREARSRRQQGQGTDVAAQSAAVAAGLDIVPAAPSTEVQDRKAEKAKEQQQSKRKSASRQTASAAPVVSVDDVAGSEEEMEQYTPTPADNLGYVDIDTGELMETMPERRYQPKQRRVSSGKVRRTNAKGKLSRMAEMQKKIDMESKGGTRTSRITPSDMLANIDATGASNRKKSLENIERLRENRDLQNILDNWVEAPPLEVAIAQARREVARENYLKAQNEKYLTHEEDARYRETHPSSATVGDEEYRIYQDLDDRQLKGDLDNRENQDKMLDQLSRYQMQRSEPAYKLTAEVKEEEWEEDDVSLEHRPWAEDGMQILRKFAMARDMIRLRLLNPLLLRIESEKVITETVKDEKGKPVTKGKVTYSDDVNTAIGNVRSLYNCSIRDVMELVQIRLGLGVDLKMLIGGKAANEFVLSDAQFIEACKDIEKSQWEHGHPMGLVEGTPAGNNVRDDEGKYVVVAGTRCFPLGYVPVGLLRRLSQDNGSILGGRSIGDIQRDIANTWINDTYPDILRQSRGNTMWQAKAIENMMRAVMSLDGIDPAELRIPEVVINKTMMQMANERKVEDPAVARAIEERARRQVIENDRFRHRYLKRSGGRDVNGSINSPMRRRNAAGDLIRGISSLEKAAKTADIFLWITSPLEAMQAMGEQKVGNFILRKMFELDPRHKGVAKDYRVTDRLSEVAAQNETIEARSVAESLYRIGGMTAIDAFFGEMDDAGRHKYELTRADLYKFMQEMGITGTSISDRVKSMFGIQPGQEKGFLFNVQNVLESSMLGSGLFKEAESRQFMSLCMMEMGNSAVHGRESYTSADVEQWASFGGAEMVRELLMTDAGREAFMMQGITSIGRKSPMDHAMRQIMSKNALTELAIRTGFDRFPEYGMNKVMRQIPLSNTLSYLASFGITGIGDVVTAVGSNETMVSGGVTPVRNAGEALQRAADYQMGRRSGFLEGLVKNLVYDTVMAGNRLLIGCVYYGMLQAFGGLHMPPRDDDKYNWSEWIIGEEEDEYRLPIKFAWWMDDLSGVGFPLGAAFAVAAELSGSENPLEWTPEAKDTAAKVFENAVANFNDGTALFDAIDLFKNFDEEMQEAIDNDAPWIDSTLTERRQTSVVLGTWRFLGDLTPTVIKQVLPWSRDFLFRDNENWYQRSASKVFNTDEYSMEDAQKQYRTKEVDSYFDYMMRKEGQNNPVAAWIMDVIWGAGGDSDRTGYKFTEQPFKTKSDPLSKNVWERYESMWEQYGADSERDPEAKKQASRSFAEAVCSQIGTDYKDPTDALTKGFILTPEARIACQEYCNYMMYGDGIRDKKNEELARLREDYGQYYLPDDIYNGVNQKYDDLWNHYKELYDDYFSGSSEIPWRLPQYKILDSDYETRYVDESGNAAVNPVMAGIVNNVANLLGVDYRQPAGEAQQYLYGNIPNDLPAYSPQRTEGFNNYSVPYWVRRDENGNLLTDAQGVYETLGGLPEGVAGPIPESASGLFGFDGVSEDDLTLGQRGLVAVNETLPDGFKEYYDPEQASRMLGFDAFDKDKKSQDDDSGDDDSSSGKGGKSGGSYGGGGGTYYYGGGRSYSGGGSYYSGGGGGYYSGGGSTYNPKIYSNAKQVYSDRASGLSTRQPYKATTTYLRPNFYTKGSREAYKRSDM